MRRMISGNELSKIKLLKNVVRDEEAGRIVSEDNIEFNGDVEFTGTVSGVGGGGHKITINACSTEANVNYVTPNGEAKQLVVHDGIELKVTLPYTINDDIVYYWVRPTSADVRISNTGLVLRDLTASPISDTTYSISTGLLLSNTSIAISLL